MHWPKAVTVLRRFHFWFQVGEWYSLYRWEVVFSTPPLTLEVSQVPTYASHEKRWKKRYVTDLQSFGLKKTTSSINKRCEEEEHFSTSALENSSIEVINVNATHPFWFHPPLPTTFFLFFHLLPLFQLLAVSSSCWQSWTSLNWASRGTVVD